MARKPRADGAGLALLVVAALFLSSASSCAAFFKKKQQPPPPPPPPPAATAEDRSPPSSRLPDPPSVDNGGRRSSTVFLIQGNVYPDGLYFVSLSIGDPPKPYFLDVDTGSDLTWVQCDAPCVSCFKGPHPLYKPTRDKLVPCEHGICASVQAAAPARFRPGGDGLQPRCDHPDDQCDYDVEYADHGSSRGVLVADAFRIGFLNGSLFRPRLAFGCGYDQRMYGGADLPSRTDGVLGLGHGGFTVLSQLREQGLTRSVMGHCLGRRGGGFLFFGDDLVPPSGVTWTPMSRRGSRSIASKYYSPGPANLFLGRQLVSKDVELIFDSGSSYTYFSSRPYEIFLNMMTNDLSGKPLKKASEDRTLPLCWRGEKPFRSVADARNYFKPLTLSFLPGSRARLDIPPEGYLILTRYGNLCLGVLNGTEAGLNDLNIIGDISVQDLMVVYDNEKGKIGWARVNCDRLPKSGTPLSLANGDGRFEGGLRLPLPAGAVGASRAADYAAEDRAEL